MDLNNALANYAVAASARAAEHRQAAAAVRAQPSTGWDETDRAAKFEARGHDAQAPKWADRADHARQGKMLVHDDDVHYQFEYDDLIQAAASAHRAVHVPDAMSSGQINAECGARAMP